MSSIKTIVVNNETYDIEDAGARNLLSDVYNKEESNTLLNEKVHKENGKSLVLDTEIARLSKVDNYDDTAIKKRIDVLESFTEEDPTVPNHVKGISEQDIGNWNSAKTHSDSNHAPSNAQANVIETVKVNGTALTPSSKAVNITVPTYSSKSAVSDGTDVSLVTTGEKYTWDNKGTYSKPSDGIPKSDLSSDVQSSLDNAELIGDLNTDVAALKGTTITSTLSAGQTSLVFSNSAITTNSTIDYYTDVYGVSASNVVVEAGKVTMTFKTRTSDLNVKVVIK